MLSHPRSKIVLAQLARRNAEHGQYAVCIASEQCIAVQIEKEFRCNKAGAFIPVEKQVVSTDAVTVGGIGNSNGLFCNSLSQ